MKKIKEILLRISQKNWDWSCKNMIPSKLNMKAHAVPKMDTSLHKKCLNKKKFAQISAKFAFVCCITKHITTITSSPALFFFCCFEKIPHLRIFPSFFFFFFTSYTWARLCWRMRRRCGGGAHTDLIMMFVNNYASLWDFLLAYLTWDCLRRWPQGDEARAPRRGSWINYHYCPLSSCVCKLTVNVIWQHWIRWSSLMSPWQI